MTDTLTARAVANVLFKPLRANAWKVYTESRDLADYGDRPNIHTTAASIRHVARALDRHIIREEAYIQATLWAEEWSGAKHLRILLDQDPYERALASQDTDHLAFVDALRRCTCRAPFEARSNRHGATTLRRNMHDPFVTPQLAQTLELVAQAAALDELTQPQVDDALIEDYEVSLNAVEAAIGKGQR